LRRRKFIALLGGAAIAWPSTLHAQQPTMPLVGFLDSSAATGAKLNAFYEGLKTEGFVRNRNVAIAYHSAEGEYARLPELASDLVNRKVSVLASAGIAAAMAAKSATTTIPVIFAIGPDPVQIGLVDSLNRPGGNITGVTDMAVMSEQRRVELLHEVIPTAIPIGLLVNPANLNAETQTRNVLTKAGTMGLKVNIIRASAESDFDKAFAMAADLRVGGMVISNDDLFVSRSGQLAALALRHAIPTIFQEREFVAGGGLISYGTGLAETYHQVGAYAGLVLKGGSAADLPVYQSSHVEFMINMKTAKSFSLSVPQDLITAANEVIE
jgi:putative ABC transport system substrate-binding protein